MVPTNAGCRLHTEKLHGPDILAPQDLQGAGYAAFTSGHQAVQVRPAHHGCVSAEANGGQDVASGHNAAVDQHGGARAQALPNGRKNTQHRG